MIDAFTSERNDRAAPFGGCRLCRLPIVGGRTLEEAADAIEELEETARLYLLLHGRETRHLGEAEIAVLRERFGGKRPVDLVQDDARAPGGCRRLTCRFDRST